MPRRSRQRLPEHRFTALEPLAEATPEATVDGEARRSTEEDVVRELRLVFGERAREVPCGELLVHRVGFDMLVEVVGDVVAEAEPPESAGVGAAGERRRHLVGG